MIQCPYVPKRVLIWFKPIAKLLLALIHAKLVKIWQAKCAKFLDIDDPKLNLNIYIGHKSVTLDEKIRIPEEKKMIIPREI